MAQFVRPDSDIATGSGWSTSGFARIREGSPGDNVVASQSSGNASAFLDKGGDSVLDPPGTTGHILRAEWRSPAGARTLNGELELWEGTPGTGTLIASLSIADLPATLQEDSYTLNGTEAGNITDYADLNLRVYYTYTGGGSPSSFEIDWIELEVPDSLIFLGDGIGHGVGYGRATGSLIVANPGRMGQSGDNHGPFVHGADLYGIFPDRTDDSLLAVWKSTDDGAEWNLAAVVATPAATDGDTIRHLSAVVDGDDLHIAWYFFDSAGSDQRLAYVAFDMSTDIAGTSELAWSGLTGTAASRGGSGIGVRSDGTVVIVYYHQDDDEIELVRRTGVDTWTGAVDVDIGSGLNGPTGVMINDEFHMIWNSFGFTDGVHHRVYRSDNTLSTVELANTRAATGDDTPGYLAVADGRLFTHQHNDISPPGTEFALHSDKQTEINTWAETTLSTDSDHISLKSGVVAVGNRAFTLWVDFSEGEIHYAEWNQSTDTWGSEVDAAIAATDDIVSYAGWLDDSNVVHIGGFKGDQSATPATFFDISVGVAFTATQAVGHGIARSTLTATVISNTLKVGTGVGHATPYGTAIGAVVGAVVADATGHAVSSGGAVTLGSLIDATAAVGHGVALSTLTASIVGDVDAAGIGHAITHSTTATSVIGPGGEDFDGWGISAGLP